MRKGKSPSGLEPICLSLLPCDYVHRDPESGRYTVLGIIRTLHAAAFPCQIAELYVYIALTDGRGRQRLTVQIVDVDEESEPLFGVSTPVTFSSPDAILEFSFRIYSIVFQAPGIFRLQLLLDDATILERAIEVQQDDV